jgi:hypothetical protein
MPTTPTTPTMLTMPSLPTTLRLSRAICLGEYYLHSYTGKLFFCAKASKIKKNIFF